MRNRPSLSRFLPLAAMLPLVACAIPPPQLAGGPFAHITVAQAQSQDLDDERVRWGGTIADVTSGEDETCFDLVSRPLDRRARPLATDETGGRFLACAPGFYDPEVWARGRELTVIGTLQGVIVRKIGEYDYRYPHLAAEAAYLWPERKEHPPYYYGPYWFGYPFYYDARYGLLYGPYAGLWPSRLRHDVSGRRPRGRRGSR